MNIKGLKTKALSRIAAAFLTAAIVVTSPVAMAAGNSASESSSQNIIHLANTEPFDGRTIVTGASTTITVANSSAASAYESPAAPGAGAPLQYKYVIECLATAYDPSPEENGGWGGMSATGVPLQKGIIAVDPKVIPLGSKVYIEALDGSWSYGYALAADTGGAIKGNRVDLLYETKKECYDFGRRNCRVYVIE